MKVSTPSFPLPAVIRLWLAVLAGVLFVGCQNVKFVSDYDEEIDRGITTFQKQVERHLAVLERGLGTPAAEFSKSEEFYDNTRIDLGLLRARAELDPKNGITVQQIDILLRHLKRLAEFHRGGLAANDIVLFRGNFSTACTAIIKFELAKKRGEKPPS